MSRLMEASRGVMLLSNSKQPVLMSRHGKAKAIIPEKLVSKAKEIVWTQSVYHGSNPNLVASVDFDTLVLQAHYEQVPAKGSTTIHRHGETIIQILAGHGHSEIHGRIIDWEPGDLVLIPAGAWHRHWCHDEKPAKFLAISTSRLTKSLLGREVTDERGYKTYSDLKDE